MTLIVIDCSDVGSYKFENVQSSCSIISFDDCDLVDEKINIASCIRQLSGLWSIKHSQLYVNLC